MVKPLHQPLGRLRSVVEESGECGGESIAVEHPGHLSQQFQVTVSHIITWQQLCCCLPCLEKPPWSPRVPGWVHVPPVAPCQGTQPCFGRTALTPALSDQFLGFYTLCSSQIFCNF